MIKSPDTPLDIHSGFRVYYLIKSTRGFVRNSEEGEDNVAGFTRPRPPSCTGRASESLSAVEHEVRPVRDNDRWQVGDHLYWNCSQHIPTT